MTANVESPEKSLPRWTILSVTTLSSFMAALDTNIVTIAIPSISKGLSSGVSLLGWVITIYALATAVLLLQSGKLGDRFGRKRVYLAGFAIFGAASAFCGLAQTVYELIAFRAVQGAGAAMLSSMAFPIIYDSFPPRERGSAVGINSIAFGAGFIAGPVLGGALVSLDWRLIFYINVPIAAAAVLIGLRRIPAKLDAVVGSLRNLNPFSSVLFALGVGSVILWLTFFDSRFALLAMAGLAVFAFVELRTRNPLLNKELLRNSGFVLSLLGLASLQVPTQAIPFVMSLYFQSVSGQSPLVAGLGLAPYPIAIVVSNPIAGRLYDRLRRPALLSLVGTLVIGASMALLAIALKAPNTDPYIYVLLALLGFGSGLVWSPTISAALKFSRPELRGVANGTAFTVLNVSFAAGVALAVWLSALSLPSSLAGQIYLGSVAHLAPAQVGLFEAALSNALLALSVSGFIGVPVFLLLSRKEASPD